MLWFNYSMSIIFLFLPLVYCSFGDSCFTQRNCVSECEEIVCSNLESFVGSQPISERILGWSCTQECEYNCMWKTVEHFNSKGWKTPQFRGKWPFVRWMGIQEPASVLASLFNLIPHLYLIRKYRSSISPKHSMYQVWTLYAIISVNTWFWSTAFHAKDSNFTEKMDYLSAFSIVTYSLIAFVLRALGVNLKSGALAFLLLAFFLQHIYYMGVIRFDYGYNMKANIAIGAINSVCWFYWAWIHWNTRPYVRTGALSVLLLNLSILLEVGDFPPIFWILDSHALWHFSTAPIHILWYKFITKDSEYEELKESKEV